VEGLSALIDKYKAKFGADALPTTMGMDPADVVKVLTIAIADERPLTAERMTALGFPPPPPGLMV
jgi:hypothetical protein